MEDPVSEITNIVLQLTQGSPKAQEDTINKYFAPDASFTHPLCRTGSFEGSRLLIHGIYRWYKIMSPHIAAKVNSIAYDEANLILYVNVSQIFAFWFIPFHRVPVTLTVQLQLVRRALPNADHSTDASRLKYLIQSQNDLYAIDQVVRFLAPWGVGTAVVYLWQFAATLVCVLLSVLLRPFTRLMQRRAEREIRGQSEGGRVWSGTHEDMRDDSGTQAGQLLDSGQQRFGNMQVVTATGRDLSACN
ncbi:hypothetical protein LTR53_013256 [Teratosphaeriaceae sp. CCFEE 6253]|nr:hypothetical protein LTR53_013256 [Teratosphaeriaceae sp. CCFEE 6253]